MPSFVRIATPIQEAVAMVARAQHLYRFTVHYTEAASLSRILDALFRAGAEPSWLFTRLSRRRCFRVDLRVADLPELKVETLAARIGAMPFIQSVKFKIYAAPPRPAAVIAGGEARV